MRSLQVQCGRNERGQVLRLARSHGARFPMAVDGDVPGSSGAGGSSLIFVALPNDAVGAFMAELHEVVAEPHVILLPAGMLPLEAPLDRLGDSVSDVSRLSTVELVAASLQSIGGWKGAVVLSVLAGAIGAYGLMFNVGYVLVAAMLINPMGAPALVAVIALAIGDLRMCGRGAVRFLVSLVLQAATAMVIGYIYRLSISTAAIEQVTSLSVLSVLVAAAAGAAGALAQVKSDRDSLVSGTASGFMVAAALAPPSAALGLSIPLGRWDYTAVLGFLLALQFFAIAAAGGLVLRLWGVKPDDPAISRGRSSWRNALGVLALGCTVAMVAWQLSLSPTFTKADASRVAVQTARDAVTSMETAAHVQTRAEFVRSDLQGYAREVLLVTTVVQRTRSAAGMADEAVMADVRRRVELATERRLGNVATLVAVTLLPPDSAMAPSGSDQ